MVEKLKKKVCIPIIRPINSTRSCHSITAYFSEKNKRYGREILTRSLLTVWKLCVFRQHINFGHFQQFFHYNCWLKWKFLILKVLSVRSISDLSGYCLFQIKKTIFFCINQFLGEKKNVFSCIFFQLLRFRDFFNSWRLYWKNHIKIY